MRNWENILDKAINWGTVVLAFLLPLFFLPITVNFYEFNKNLLITLFAGVLVLACVAKMICAKRVTFVKTPLDLPVALVAISYLGSALIASPNRFSALTSPGAAGTILALTVLFFVITNNFKRENLNLLINGVILSAALASLLTIYQFIGVGAAFTQIPWLAAKTFTPLGGLLTLALFLAVSLPLALEKVVKGKKTSVASSFFPSLATFLILAGAGTAIYQLVGPNKPILLPYKTGWAIAIETLKISPLFGVSPANFLSAFTRFKPINFNASDFWTFRFGISSNWYFQVLTTVGVLGLSSLLFLLWRARKVIGLLKEQKAIPFSVAALVTISLVAMAFLPPNLILLFFLYLFLACSTFGLPRREYAEESRILPWLIFLIAVPLVLASFYFMMGKVLAAEIYFKRSLDALIANRGGEAYSLQIQAITTNPYQDAYRVAYSQTNLALANSIATAPDLTDQDRQQISVLIQQAIREAKAAGALNRENVVNWENLASIYRSLINLAAGSEDWTIASYQTAISLDPANPSLRVSLGGVFYSLQNWDEAIRQFEIAVGLKPNFANGHYNLAASLREKGEYARAASEMEAVLALVPGDSGDWQRASSELEELRKRLGEEVEEVVKPPESLTPPEALPEGIEPPIELPEEVGPEVSPTPSPTPTPTPGE